MSLEVKPPDETPENPPAVPAAPAAPAIPTEPAAPPVEAVAPALQPTWDEAVTPAVLPTPEEVEATVVTTAEPDPAPLPDPMPSRRPRLLRLARLRRAVDWSWLVVLVPFAVLFLMTVLPRFTVPFELEWMEGQSAEQAWRFTQGLPLYPKQDANWVPYMYTPLYHVVFGGLMEISGRWTLAWGRLISLLSTFATMGAILMIVYDRTRRLAPACFAALLYTAYFKPTGFWYDIVRVDAFAFALAIWGTYLTTKNKVTFWQGFWGVLLLLAGTLTKQSVGLIAVACMAILLWKNLRAAMLGGLASLFLLVNLGYLMDRGGNPAFLDYVVTNTLRHPASPGVYMPGSQWPGLLYQEVREAKAHTLNLKPTEVPPEPGYWDLAKGYVAKWKELGPPMLWKECLRHCWLLMLLPLPWMLMAFVRGRMPRGAIFLLPAALFIYGACKSYALYGGFMNNFLPLFLAVCVVAGLAMDGIRRNLSGWWRIVGIALFTLLVTLQIFQPWNLPDVTNGAAHWDAWKSEPDSRRRQSVDALVEYDRRRANAQAAKQPFTEPAPRVPFAHRLAYCIGRWNAAGLGWFPSHQQPSPRARQAHDALIAWLTKKAKAREPVWVMHHQWYGILTGHPLGASVDAIRCAMWAGDPLPPTFRADLEDGRYKWLILDNLVEYDWQAGDVGQLIQQKYEFLGTLPALNNAGGPEALKPVTGAEVKPYTVLRYKGFDGSVE